MRRLPFGRCLFLLALLSLHLSAGLSATPLAAPVCGPATPASSPAPTLNEFMADPLSEWVEL